jgi:hypothetical protein
MEEPDDRGPAGQLKNCKKANVPDKSGEMLTQEGAQHSIDDLKQVVERNAKDKRFLAAFRQ